MFFCIRLAVERLPHGGARACAHARPAMRCQRGKGAFFSVFLVKITQYGLHSCRCCDIIGNQEGRTAVGRSGSCAGAQLHAVILAAFLPPVYRKGDWL
ncbi:hypothetical protein D7X33_13585 [Butyricicoccus sp. 1XD8-22]|nr:hypothetical protein D7X33_13585 [Butyricicoccus sp. 1XD8-22]